MLPSSSLNIWHVGRLLIRFALGVLKGNPTIDYEKSILSPATVFQQKLYRNSENSDTVILHDFDTGTLMIEFLRYLASQSFALSETISLRVFFDTDIIEPILRQKEQWLPLHHVSSSIFKHEKVFSIQIAYRAFHSLAVSGCFDTLNLNSDFVEHVAESKDPILVNESVFSCKNYNDDFPITRSRILQSLKV